MYKNILVAVDTSDEAEDVLRAARQMAETDGATLSVITVIKPLASFYVDLYAVLGDQGTIESQAIDHTREWLANLANRNGVAFLNTRVAIGAPATDIRAFAEELGADLIVIGTHGQHGLGLLLGSTANAVLHGAPCDVLTVRV